jgi:adenylate kinase family enzyme
MAFKPQVILIAGPAGAGKTSIADRIAQEKGWIHLSEDSAWDAIKDGHPMNEQRSPAEEVIAQAMTVEHLERAIRNGKRVVLEFILYEDPPRPLLNYQQILTEKNIPFMTRILRPQVDEIIRRIQKRGRKDDADLDDRRRHAYHQIRCLDSMHILDEWVIDTTSLSLEEVYVKHFKNLVTSD